MVVLLSLDYGLVPVGDKFPLGEVTTLIGVVILSFPYLEPVEDYSVLSILFLGAGLGINLTKLFSF